MSENWFNIVHEEGREHVLGALPACPHASGDGWVVGFGRAGPEKHKHRSGPTVALQSNVQVGLRTFNWFQ